MAIRMMTDESEKNLPNVEVVTDHWSQKVLFMKTTHVGLVLDTGEHNYHDDSDFYAIVWNEVANEPVKIIYGTTRGWTYPNGASVDATPEILQKHQTWKEAKAAREQSERDEKEAKKPSLGKTVTVVKGIKVPVGTTGKVFWVSEPRRFGDYGKKVVTIGVATSERKGDITRNEKIYKNSYLDAVFVNANYVEVVAT